MLLLWCGIVFLSNYTYHGIRAVEEETILLSRTLDKINKQKKRLTIKHQPVMKNKNVSRLTVKKTWTQVSSEYNENRWKTDKCSCKYINDVSKADFVFAHPHKTKINRRFPQQKWIAQFWESEGNYPSINTESFDFERSYRADAAFPNYAMMMETFRVDQIANPVPFNEKKKEEMISVWISNCGFSKRLHLLDQLKRKGISYASYGKCKHDHVITETLPYMNSQIKTWDTDKTEKWHHSGSQKMAHGSQYLFLYAAENNISPYYHTEKVFHALMCGSVPIYIGHKTIYEYVPEHSIIMADDYGDKLGEYLIELAANETLYNSYLTWRSKPLPVKMMEKVNFEPASVCDICNVLSA